jgi:hypothetical protein
MCLKKLIFQRYFLKKIFLNNNVYLIDFIFFIRVCGLFFLLSPKTIPKTGVKTTAPKPLQREPLGPKGA